MKLFAEVNLLLNIYSMQYKYSNLHEIYLVFLLSQSLIDTLAREVKCLRVIERRDRGIPSKARRYFITRKQG